MPAGRAPGDFHRICGIAFALVLAVVLVVAVQGHRPTDSTLAGTQHGSAQAVGSMASTPASGPPVNMIRRAEAPAHGF